jgi:hypothetical protein
MNKQKKQKLLIGLVVLLVVFLSNAKAIAQKKDSTDIYLKIKDKAYKRNLTTLLYHAIFAEPQLKENTSEKVSIPKNVSPYLKQKDKIIRNINISVYNPFGHKVEDTTLRLDNFLENIANHLHITTRHWIIINRLLFKNNDTLNPLALSETERLLRLADFINDAKIYVVDTLNSNLVDINVEVHDKWPITAPSYLSAQDAHITFINQNLFGIGQQFEQYVGFKAPNVFDYSGMYSITNLDNTYISSQLSYKTTVDGTFIKLAFDRPYFSPLAKWAGGIDLNHNWGFYNYIDSANSINKKLTLNNLGYDVWLGKSLKFKKDKTIFNQSTNIILGGRYFTNTFLARPDFNIDTSKSNYNTSAFIGNFGLSIQKYYKDKFIYRFGANEDVPEGLIIQGTYGISKMEFNTKRFYAGFEIARAKKISFGYITSTISTGIFFNKYIKNDVTTKFSLNYLGNLAKSRRWYFRQFVNYNIVHGENKTAGQTITINSNEMYGFNSNSLTGNTKMIINSETVAYAPYELIGFRFASVISAGFGIIGSKKTKIEKSPLYQAYSLGIMIRNEHLVSSTFQISVGLYPFLPDGTNNAFLFNPLTSFTLRVRTFSMGRPEFISY